MTTLVHTVAVVLVGVAAQQFYAPVGVLKAQVGVVNAVEHGCFDRGVVYHVLEYHLVAGLQRAVKMPLAHEVAAQATVAAYAVNALGRV